MKKVELCPITQCTGCMACKQTCSHNAIKIDIYDGFAYPIIDDERCTKCRLCVASCPIINKANLRGNIHENEKKCIAAWSKDVNVRLASSSGGIFTVLATYILDEGGVVFGAAWDDDMVLRHKSIEKKENLAELQRSKYVQSDIGDTYKEAKQRLDENKAVLFSGTPCQIAGLHLFLRKKYAKLVTVDVLCQGVPSPVLFKKYLHEIEVEQNTKIVDCNFRSKKKGWRCGLFQLLLKTEAGKVIKRTLLKNEFYNSFIKGYFMRNACYECRFKDSDLGYYSDLTIADFWRIGNNTDFDITGYEMGISAVVVNTERGKYFFDQIKDRINFFERTWEEFSTNGGLRRSEKPLNNDEALMHLNNSSWAENQKKYYQLTFRELFSRFVWLLMGEKRIRRIKRLIRRK